MKFGLEAPYTKTMKKSKGDNRSTAVDQRLGASHRIANQSSQIWSNNISINCQVYVLSEKYKNHMLKINRETPSVLFATTLNKFLT